MIRTNIDNRVRQRKAYAKRNERSSSSGSLPVPTKRLKSSREVSMTSSTKRLKPTREVSMNHSQVISEERWEGFLGRGGIVDPVIVTTSTRKRSSFTPW